MAFFGIWIVQHLSEIRNFQAEVQTEYAALNAQFPFTPPGSAARVEPDRIDAYARAHERLVDAVTRKADARARELLDNPSLGRMKALRMVGDFFPFLKAATGAHLRTLEEERMSMDEYVWIHGLVMLGIMRRNPSDPEREAAELLLDRLEKRLADVDTGAGEPFTARAYREELAEFYRDASPPDSTPGRGFDELPTLGALFDLAMANPSIMRKLNLRSGGQ